MICTAHLQAGLFVRVTHAVTGAPLAEGATVMAREGGFLETLVHYQYDQVGGTQVVISRLGVYERPGTYRVEVSHPGFEPAVVTGIRVTADECHVIPRNVDVQLFPL